MDAFLSEAECLGSGYLPWEGGAGTQEVPGGLLLQQPIERALPISPGGEFHPVALSRQREQEPERGKAANPGISHTANAETVGLSWLSSRMLLEHLVIPW